MQGPAAAETWARLTQEGDADGASEGWMRGSAKLAGSLACQTHSRVLQQLSRGAADT